MTPREIEDLLERYHVLDTRGHILHLPLRRRRSSPEPVEIRAAIQRADIDRALVMLRRIDESLWFVIKLVHVIPYPDRAHADYQEDLLWFMHYADRLRYSLTTRRQLAALDLSCAYGTVYARCYSAYRVLASALG